MERMVKVIKNFWKIATIIIVSIAVILAILLAGIRVIGFKPYTVLSGSMEPHFHVGSIIYVRNVDPETFKKGDTVTYNMDGNVVTHRVNDILHDDDGRLYYQTKGDANQMVDAFKLYPEKIIGKPIFSIPLLGFVSNFIQKPPGTFIVIGVCALFVFLSTLTELIFGAEENKVQAENPDKPETEEQI